MGTNDEAVQTYLRAFDEAASGLALLGVDVLAERGLTTKPVVVVTRHPDYENDITVYDGDAEVVSLDLGAAFDSEAQNMEQWTAWVGGYADILSGLRDGGHDEAADAIQAVLDSAKPDAT